MLSQDLTPSCSKFVFFLSENFFDTTVEHNDDLPWKFYPNSLNLTFYHLQKSPNLTHISSRSPHPDERTLDKPRIKMRATLLACIRILHIQRLS